MLIPRLLSAERNIQVPTPERGNHPKCWKPDRVGKALASPPSEPCVRFSRTRLSSRQFPHRDGLANGFPRANPPFRVTATARKSSAGLQPVAGLDRSRFSGHLPEGCPVFLTVSVPAFPPSYPHGKFVLPLFRYQPRRLGKRFLSFSDNRRPSECSCSVPASSAQRLNTPLT